MRVGIVGGGLMALAVADRLTAMGHQVRVFERNDQVGGLATWKDFEHFVWDRFYHVILPTDTHLIAFLKQIGLGDRLRWETTGTGVYVDRNMYSVSSTMEFLKFPPLSLWSKFRLGLTIFYCAMINDWRRLETTSVEDFLIRISGRTTYEKFWKPLLLAKLGESYRRASAVFIWTYIKRLYSARSSSAQREQLGYVAGGYRTVFDTLVNRIVSQGGQVKTGATVGRVETSGPRSIDIEVDGRSEKFDKVVFTSPVSVLNKACGPGLIDQGRTGSQVEYLGVVCAVLLTSKPIVPFYVVNIADARIPFTGIIGMSNVVSTSETAGIHLTYLPKYVLSTDPFLQRSDDDIREQFLGGLKTMLPAFDDGSIIDVQVHRAFKVQPLQVINYSRISPKVRTMHPDFYVLNTAQFVNNTLNNNEVIGLVNRFFEQYGEDFLERSDNPASK